MNSPIILPGADAAGGAKSAHKVYITPDGRRVGIEFPDGTKASFDRVMPGTISPKVTLADALRTAATLGAVGQQLTGAEAMPLLAGVTVLLNAMTQVLGAASFAPPVELVQSAGGFAAEPGARVAEEALRTLQSASSLTFKLLDTPLGELVSLGATTDMPAQVEQASAALREGFVTLTAALTDAAAAGANHTTH
jgi:hypothetical protein